MEQNHIRYDNTRILATQHKSKRHILNMYNEQMMSQPNDKKRYIKQKTKT